MRVIRCPGTWAIIWCFLRIRNFSGNWIGSRIARTWTSIPLWEASVASCSLLPEPQHGPHSSTLLEYISQRIVSFVLRTKQWLLASPMVRVVRDLVRPRSLWIPPATLWPLRGTSSSSWHWLWLCLSSSCAAPYGITSLCLSDLFQNVIFSVWPSQNNPSRV